MLTNRTRYFSFLFCLSSFSIFAQSQGNSPYSVFGIGDVDEPTTAANVAMGGTGLTTTSGFFIPSLNPALVVKNRVLGGYRYVGLNFGLNGTAKTIQNASLAQQDFGMNLNHISAAFPILDKWAMSVALRPYSQVTHTTRFSTNATIPGTTQTAINEVKSTGGLSRVGWTNSVLLGKSLYLGVEAFHTFGVILRDTTTTISTNNVASNEAIRFTNRTSVGGSGVRLGAVWQQKLSKKWQLNAGGTYEVSNQLKGEYLRQLSNVSDNGTGFVLSAPADTLLLADARISLPHRVGGGISLESPFHWVFALEYSKTFWNQYQSNVDPVNGLLRNADKLAMGIEWLPKANSTKYFDQVFYRIGYTRQNTPFVINGTRIRDNSFTAGLSLPLGFRSPSYVDIAMAFGRRGTTVSNLIQENYWKIQVNFALLGSWFVKPRID